MEQKDQSINQLEDFIQQEKAKIVSETAKINWKELETFFAQGKLILIDRSLDLIDVAFTISTDDAKQVSEWMESELVLRDFTHKAIAFEKDNKELWSVVIKPWVLIQELKH
ncbi:MAG: DUF2288 domain-containing protein [Pseudomonadota bacterium]